MRNTSKTFLMLVVACFLFILLAASVKAESTKELLEKYATNKTYLGNNGKTYHGYLIKTEYDDGSYGISYYPPDNIPNNPISYRIDDFDEDGKPELLIVRFNNKYNAILDIYEVENDTVVRKDSTNVLVENEYDDEEITVDIGLELDVGKFNCFTYSYNGKKVIGIEESGCGLVNADGTWIGFAMLSYNGSKIINNGSAWYLGSDYDDDIPDELSSDFKKLGVNVAKILSREKLPSDFISDSVIFAGVIHDTPDNLYETYCENDRYKAGRIDNISNISFIMKNTGASDIGNMEYSGVNDTTVYDNIPQKYYDFLKKESEKYKNRTHEFALAYIDNNNIPDLLYRNVTNDTSNSFKIYYMNGRGITAANRTFVGRSTDGNYFPKTGIVCIQTYEDAHKDQRIESYYKVNDKKEEFLIGRYYNYSSNTGYYHLQEGKSYESERHREMAEFDAILKKEVGNTPRTKFKAYINNDANRQSIVFAHLSKDSVQKSTKTNATSKTKSKKNNPLTVKASKKTIKYKKVKKKSQKVTCINVSNAKGNVSYIITGGNKKSKKALKINKNTGKITVKKKTKKGTYKVKVTVKAAGNSQYNAGSKTVEVKIVIK